MFIVSTNGDTTHTQLQCTFPMNKLPVNTEICSNHHLKEGDLLSHTPHTHVIHAHLLSQPDILATPTSIQHNPRQNPPDMYKQPHKIGTFNMQLQRKIT